MVKGHLNMTHFWVLLDLFARHIRKRSAVTDLILIYNNEENLPINLYILMENLGLFYGV
jgi:hypothetical protein